jgi:exodeoxyribonuclease V alpha subunit
MSEQNQPANQTTILTGVVERLTFTNPDDGYTVARFNADRYYGQVTIVGALAQVHPGARLKLTGRWKSHPKYGDQFEIERYVEEMPATVEGIKRYLGSGLIKGIGPAMARRIAEKFGAYTLDVIESDVGRLAEVEGIGPRRVNIIAAAWEAQKQIKEIMLFLQSHQVSTNLAVKIYKTYGDESIGIVKNDPYRLARDIYGVGFLTADKIARNIGIAADAPQRVAAGIEYTLNQMSDQGHVFVPRPHLIEAAVKILAVMPEQVDAQIEALRREERVIVETVQADETGPAADNRHIGPQNFLDAVYLPPFYFAEIGVARRIKQLLTAPASRLPEFAGVDWAKAFAWLAATQTDGITLAEHQQQAVQMALTRRVGILTGGPGTGKTSTVKAVLRLLHSKGKQALLAAPTGRAAKRLAESTGHEAKTLHRLLEVSPGEGFKFQRNQDNPLEADLIIVDECSMIDLILMNSLLKAVEPAAHLLLVGDADQLPSVGAGNVLRDLIDSGVVPVTRLAVIFRQAAGSAIITNAHRINQGDMPLFSQ